MRFVLPLFLMLAATGMPANAATVIADPVAFVKGVYAHWNSDQRVPENIYTARLSSLIALDNREAHGEVGRGNDFSVWCNCQDGELKNPRIVARDVENAKGRKVVAAKFDLDDRKEEIIFYFEHTKAGWKIDDIRSTGKEAWTCSLLLKYGWDSRQ